MWDARSSRAATGTSASKVVQKHYGELPSTPLWNALVLGDAAAVHAHLTPELLNRAVAVDQATPLHVAVLCGHAQVTQDLLALGASLQLRDKNGATPLHVAAQFGHSHIVAELIAAGADPAAKDQFGQTPFYLAHRPGHKDVMRILKTAVRGKYEDRQEEMFVAFCTRTARSDGKSLKTVSAPIPLSDAHPHMTSHQSAPVPPLPTPQEAEVSTEGIESWRAAVKGADMVALEGLYEQYGTGIINCKDQAGRTALHRAAASGSMDLLQFCLSRGACVNSTDKAGRTALHFAALDGQEAAVEALLQHSAGCNIVDEEGRSPLHYAAAYACRGVVLYLVEAGALRSITDKDEKTPYAWAKEKGNSDLLALLQTREMPSRVPVLPAVIVENYIPQAVPSVFCCPITHEVMSDPVVAMDGNSYERSAISEWFRRNHTSPMTNEPIRTTLIPNHALRSEILEWRGHADQPAAV